MRLLYYDCFCGISGDMNLAALLDVGADEEYLRGELSRLGLDEEYELQIKRDKRGDISGSRLAADCEDDMRFSCSFLTKGLSFIINFTSIQQL